MRKFFKFIHFKHRNFWNKEHLRSLLNGGIFFGLALIIQRIADVYVGKVQGVAVNDIILNNIPTIDIDSFIILSCLILTFTIVFLFINRPQYVIFGVKALSIFLITRSFFITLTHLGASPHELQFDPNSIGYWLYNVLYNTHGDFFFSGHTGIPFLMSLIFWQEKYWRYFFLIATAIFGVVVLLAHIHYSIDVFAAPFMTYGIYAIAKYLFKKDYELIPDE
jgi:hypothetical protein